jgi:hypothetical protein
MIETIFILAAFILFVIEAVWHRSLLAAGLACLVLGVWLLPLL